MTQINHFVGVFEDLKSNGFDTSNKLVWSFFFFNEDETKLRQVIKELDGYGYTTELSKFENEFRLIANKIEILNPEKLEKRNIAFSKLADYCDVLYDGWEVSK
jgi:hypothetical protein